MHANLWEMQHPMSARILADLQAVANLRAAQAERPGHRQRVAAVKGYQSRRFANTYGDMLVDPHCSSAARFFLEDLYGATDFSHRDQQFARIVPALVKLFPGELVDTVALLAQLHALSESLDDAMAQQIEQGPITAAAYQRAWRAVGHEPERTKQIELALAIGRSLARVTKRRMLRTSLRMMRTPAHAAGMGALQDFLEKGFDAFAAMDEPERFLGRIEAREQVLATALFLDPPGHLPNDAQRQPSDGDARMAAALADLP